MADEISLNLTGFTVELLSAFVSNNNVRAEDLAGLIGSTHAALAGLTAAEAQPETPEEEVTPAVTVRKSLADRNYIVSMIDGKPYRTLKRHLTSNGLTPAEYRSRYNLPASYPMVAPGYSDQRRDVAHRLGLGRKPAKPAPEMPAPVAAEAPKVRKPRQKKQALGAGAGAA